MKQNIEAGSAIRELTPGKPQMLQGYGARDKASEGILDTPQVGCIALRGETLIAIVTFDMIGMHSSEAGTIKRAIEQETGIPSSHIMLSCSHTHFAPGISTTIFSDPRLGITDPDQEFVQLVIENAVAAVGEAVSRLSAAELAVYRCRVPQVPFNRRTINTEGMVETNFMYPLDLAGLSLSPVDDELTVFRFDFEAGGRTYLLNFGCHPVTGGAGEDRDFYKISADYIHFIRETISEREGAETHFTLGSAGDVVPMNRAGRSRENIGSILAGSALLGDRAFRSSDSLVDLETQTIEVDVVTGIGLPEMDDQKFEELQNRLAADDQLDQEAFQEELHRRFSALIYPTGNFTIPIQFIRIGETILVTLPFEVFSELSITMKKKYPGTVLVSCANGYQGYLPFEHEIARGGYEAQNRSMHFSPGTAEKVQQAIMNHLESFAK